MTTTPESSTASTQSRNDAQSCFDAEFERQLQSAAASAPYIETLRDEGDARRLAIAQGMLARLDARHSPQGSGGYAGMTLLEIARELAEAQGIRTRGLTGMQLARTAFHATSDFPVILAGVAQKRLRAIYEQSPQTYRTWARRAPDAKDFKAIQVVQLSGAPDLVRVNEHGEFTMGTLRESGETYSLLTAGRMVGFTRRAIMNDDLRAFDTLIRAFAFSAARFENAMVYGILTANAAMADGQPLFSGASGQRAQSNIQSGPTSVLSVDALNTGRSQMRRMNGLSGEPLNTAARYLIVPSALEHTAYQLTSSNYVPAQPSEVNEFREGGRAALAPVVEPLLDLNSATRWYLAANTSQVDTVEYCYLEGSDGPLVEYELGFDIDGIRIKCRIDFGAKAIDHRGLHRSAGA